MNRWKKINDLLNEIADKGDLDTHVLVKMVQSELSGIKGSIHNLQSRIDEILGNRSKK